MLSSTELLHFLFIFQKTIKQSEQKQKNSDTQTKEKFIYKSKKNILYINNRWILQMSFNLPHQIHALSAKRILLLIVRQSVAGAFTKGSSKSKVLHWPCCLESIQFFLSSNHPNMQEMSPLKTKSSVQAISKNVNLGSQTSSGDQVSTTTMSPKIARLSNLEVSELITRNKTSNEAELFPISHT